MESMIGLKSVVNAKLSLKRGWALKPLGWAACVCFVYTVAAVSLQDSFEGINVQIIFVYSVLFLFFFSLC